jgi:hypothetical protein
MGAWAEEPFGTDIAAGWAVEFDRSVQVSGMRLIEVALAACCRSCGNTVSRTGGS